MGRLGERRRGGTLQELERDECFELLKGKSVGRISYCTPSGPVVVPVNYVLDKGTILLRTSPYNSLATALRSVPAAFQVDEVDEFLQAGWSVLVQGHADYAIGPEEVPRAASERPEPWVGGSRTLYVRVTPQQITGRRLLPT